MTIDGFFADRVSVRTELPISWQGLQAPLDEGQLAGLNEKNLALLRAVNALEDHHGEGAEGGPVPAPEIQRLEAKLDLLLTLVGQLRMSSQQLPASVSTQLAAAGVAWWPLDAVAAEVDDTGLLDISLGAYVAQPLSVPARILVHEIRDERDVVLAGFEGLSQQVAEALDKFVFRHHRRAIAGSRVTD